MTIFQADHSPARAPAIVLQSMKNDDVLEVEPGVYTNNRMGSRLNGITIRVMGGKAHFISDKTSPGVGTWGPGMGSKGCFVVMGDKWVLEDLEISGGFAIANNAGGVRIDSGLGGSITLRRCSIHDNPNGVFGGRKGFKIVVEDCDIFHNGGGSQSGLVHNLYINTVDEFILRNSRVSDCDKGHLVKTRARKNLIEDNQLIDGPDGASYQVDISGGDATVRRNKITKALNAANKSSALHYYISRDPDGPHRLDVLGNDFDCELVNPGAFVRVRSDATVEALVNGALVKVPANVPVTALVNGNKFRARRGIEGGKKNYDYGQVPIQGVGAVTFLPGANTVIYQSEAPAPSPGPAPFWGDAPSTLGPQTQPPPKPEDDGDEGDEPGPTDEGDEGDDEVQPVPVPVPPKPESGAMGRIEASLARIEVLLIRPAPVSAPGLEAKLAEIKALAAKLKSTPTSLKKLIAEA